LTKAQGNPRIKIVVKPLEDLLQYRHHKEKWIENHSNNIWLNQKVGWEVSVLWAEKVHFVQQTIEENYFPNITPSWYGWCDIGYFRPQSGGCLTAPQIKTWPNPEKLVALDRSKIHYALVNPYIIDIVNCVKETDPHTGLPQPPISPNQVSVAGGFFLITKQNLEYSLDTTRIRFIWNTRKILEYSSDKTRIKFISN
jgi:hypothetical protein